MIRKQFEIVVTEKREDGGRIQISTGTVDRQKDRVFPGGARIENYLANPVVQWGHNYHEPWATIGRTTELSISEEGIVADFELRPPANEHDPQNVVRLLWEGGWINAASIGFEVGGEERAWEENEHGGRNYLAWELLEWSLVPIPANQEALRLAVKGLGEAETRGQGDGETGGQGDGETRGQGGEEMAMVVCEECGAEYEVSPMMEAYVLAGRIPRLCDEHFRKELMGKTVVPFGDEPLADEGRAWDAAAARRRLQEWAGGDDWEPARYRRGFVFVDGEPDLLGSYKGPHHDVSGGRLVTVWNGVRAAMASLVFGARGGRIADGGDRRGVYNHLARHYREFDKDVPEFRGHGDTETRGQGAEDRADNGDYESCEREGVEVGQDEWEGESVTDSLLYGAETVTEKGEIAPKSEASGPEPKANIDDEIELPPAVLEALEGVIEGVGHLFDGDGAGSRE